MSYEHDVQDFYDSALHCYQKIMGDYWHHGDPEALAVGLPRERACQLLNERVVALTGISQRSRVLDFGSGIGGPTLHRATVSGGAFVGVSNNDRLNATARDKAAARGLSARVSFQTLDDTAYRQLPFPDASFDAVTFYDSVCHLPDKQAFFREVARVLKPGGRVGGIDWLQRPFGAHQEESAIMRFMAPVNELIRIPWHGTLEGYKGMMVSAGLSVFVARDLFAGEKCWGPVQDAETPVWAGYDGPDREMFRQGDIALAAAREAGVFTVGIWFAGKPS